MAEKGQSSWSAMAPSGAGDDIETIADMLAAPVVKSLLGKAVIPDDSPYTTGGLGLLGTLPSEKAMEECDSLLLVGTNFPYMAFLPKPGQARAVQIDSDPGADRSPLCGRRRIDGGWPATLMALLPLLERRRDRSFLEKAQGRVKEWNTLMHARETRDESPMKPQVVARLLTNIWMIMQSSRRTRERSQRGRAHIHMRRGMLFSCSGNLATMAPGLPYAIAAKAAYPDRQVVAFVGDGGFSMLMADFVTAVKHNLPITVVIIKNNVLGQIKWEQMIFLGNPEYGVELHPIDFVKVAEACGGVGFHCESPAEVRGAIRAAFASKKPAIVEAVVDPYEPPMPAQATAKQGLRLAESLVRGQPNGVKIATTIFRDKLSELL